MSKRHLRAPPPTKEKSTPSIVINDFMLFKVMPKSCITNCNEPSWQIAGNTQSVMVVII